MTVCRKMTKSMKCCVVYQQEQIGRNEWASRNFLEANLLGNSTTGSRGHDHGIKLRRSYPFRDEPRTSCSFLNKPPATYSRPPCSVVKSNMHKTFYWREKNCYDKRFIIYFMK